MIIPVNGINRAVVQAVNFGRAIAPDVRAVYVTDDLEAADALRERWERQLPEVPLVYSSESPYRVVISPVVAYLDILDTGLAAGQGGAGDDRRATPATWPVIGGTVSSTTRRQSDSRRHSWVANTRSSPTSRTGV